MAGGSCACTIQFREREEDKSPTIHHWDATEATPGPSPVGGQHLGVSCPAPSTSGGPWASKCPVSASQGQTRPGGHWLFKPRDGAASRAQGAGEPLAVRTEEAQEVEKRPGPRGTLRLLLPSRLLAGRTQSGPGPAGPGAKPSHRETRLLVERKENKEARFLRRWYKKPLKKPP